LKKITFDKNVKVVRGFYSGQSLEYLMVIWHHSVTAHAGSQILIRWHYSITNYSSEFIRMAIQKLQHIHLAWRIFNWFW